MNAARLLGIVSWDPVLTGYLAVFLSIVVLCGSVYLLLATNLGLRLGFLVAWTGLWGWMLLMALVWWVFGIGWIGRSPTWEVIQVTSNPATVPISVVQDLAGADPESSAPEPWTAAEEVDARSAADSHIVCADTDPRRLEAVNPCLFTAATDFYTYRVLVTGGERYRPLGIPDNVLTQYFFPSRGKPSYAVVQLQPYQARPEVDPNVVDADGKVVLPEAVRDEAAPIYSVVLVRDLGSVRLRPALLAVVSGLLFGLGCYHLHRRDQAVWAVREAAEAGV